MKRSACSLRSQAASTARSSPGGRGRSTRSRPTTRRPLEAAGEALAALGSPLDAAESFAWASARYREAGRRDAARRAAERARAIAAPCDAAATPALAEVRTGAVAALSARELHVARLAARGASRRAIAEEMGLSVSTVGNHLNHVYAKLGVSDRAALAALLEASPAD